MTGQLQTSTRAGQRLDWTYDGQLPVRETSSGIVGGSVSRRYDSDFRIIEVAVNDAGVGYAYDNDSLLTAAGPVALGRSATTGQLLTSTTGNVVTSYTYDVYGAPASMETRVGSTVVFREALTWDDIGRVSAKDVSVQGTATRWDYAYDAASRLVQTRRDGTAVGAWGYDANGNRLSADGVTSTFDAQDRQLTSSVTTFTHDAFGSRTSMTATGQTTRYVYDGVGGLLSATLPDGTSLEYVIDSRGRRVGKKRNGALEKGWLYDGQLRIIAEVDATGAVTSRFVYGTLSHSPDVMLRAGVTYRYVHDALGSVRLVVNVSTGQVVQRIDYDSWGVVTSDSSPGFQPFAFAGGLFDVDTQLTRFGARDYDAAVGRWTSKDPIRLAGGVNVYSFSLCAPTYVFDVSGLKPLTSARRKEVESALTRISCVSSYGPYADMLQDMLRAGNIEESEPGINESLARVREIGGSIVPAYHSNGKIYLRSSVSGPPLTGTLLHELFHNLNWRDGQAEGEDNTATSATQRIEDDFIQAESSDTHHKYDMAADACKCKQ